MRYLITTANNPPFFSEWYDFENHFNLEVGMTVYDLVKFKFTTDGKTWTDIHFDHL
jgi:hypothetical protein